MPAVLALVWQYRQIILEGIAIIILGFAIWWFCIHNPKVIADQKAKIENQTRQIESAQGAITLLSDIQQGKAKIDEKVQAQLTSVHHIVFKHRTSSVFLRAGRGVLPPMPAIRKTTR